MTAPPETGPRGASDDELLAAMVPFNGGDGISQALYKALYQLRNAYHWGPNGREEALARLASMNPARLKIPATPDGRRLRAALHTLHNQHAQP
ncbi:hypothetical protein ACWCPT_32355 [Streptomyces sp. NPDC002308]